MKLNLGCGDNILEGYLNIDLRDLPGVMQYDVRRLPFGNESADEILALDCLEHFWKDQIPLLVAEWRRVLKPTGTMCVRVPNLIDLSRKLDSIEHDQIIENIYGAHRFGPNGSWDMHHWGWTPFSFQRDMFLYGMQIINNDLQPNMTVTMMKLDLE